MFLNWLRQENSNSDRKICLLGRTTAFSQISSDYVPKKRFFTLCSLHRYIWFDVCASCKLNCCIWISFLKFSLSISVLIPAICSTHLKPKIDFVLAFLCSGFRETFVKPRTCRILLRFPICSPFELRYYFSIKGSAKALPRLYVNSKSLNLRMLSPRMVFASDLHVFWIKTRAFKAGLVDLILVEWLVDNKSATSTPPFVWSYIVCTCEFFHFSFVIFTLSCMVVKTIAFFSSIYTYMTVLFSELFNALT